MKNKKSLIICIVAILTLVCITVGVSLAFFNYAGKGSTDNTLETGSITFLYTETSNAGRGIAITDVFPISDSEGKALTGEGNVFDFNISSSKSGHNKRIDYEITARLSDDSTLDEDVVVMYLTKVNGIEEKEILLDKYSNLADTEKVSGYNEKTLYKTAVYVADDSYNQDFRLRMWITNDGTFEQEDMGKTFKVNVNVYADAKVVEQGQIAFENNTLIDNLKVGNSTINPVENEEFEYDTVLPYDTTEANIIIETVNPNATVDIKNVTSNYAYTNIISKVSTIRKLEGLVNGDNYFDITITSENGKVEDEYILKVEVKDITPPELEITSVDKTTNTLTINYNTSDSDTSVKSVTCDYGTSSVYGNSVVCSNGVCVINGLGLGTEYFYKITSKNISDSEKVIESKVTTNSCEAGYYGGNGASSCSKCPTGYTSEAGSQNVNSCYVSLTKGQGKTETGLATSCASGTYMSDAVSKAYYGTAYNCTTCEAGTYNSGTGNSECTTCEAGYFCTGGTAKTACSTLGTGYTSAAGAKANTSCYISLTAGQGKTKTGLATSCAAGYYYGSARTAYYGTAYNCNRCSSGYATNTGTNVGASKCTACPVGYYCYNGMNVTRCQAGRYNTGTGNSSCTTCEEGYYCTGGSNHTSCGSGKTSAAGSTVASACYRPTQFSSVILVDNSLVTTASTLTTSSNNTSDPSGLYKSTATNSGNPTYYFRGNVNNNYVSFAGLTWRIVRINEDGTVRLILADGINNNATYKFNTASNDYKYMYYTNSDTIKPTVDSWYTSTLASYSDKIATGNYFCEEVKVKKYSNDASGITTSVLLYSDYNPNFRCSTDVNGKGIVNTNIGLITYDEVVYAGGYINKTNDNYYLYSGASYWTMSSGGVDYEYAITWYVSSNSSFYTDYVNNTKAVRPVINLKADIAVTGTGTSTDPYVVQ